MKKKKKNAHSKEIDKHQEKKYKMNAHSEEIKELLLLLLLLLLLSLNVILTLATI